MLPKKKTVGEAIRRTRERVQYLEWICSASLGDIREFSDEGGEFWWRKSFRKRALQQEQKNLMKLEDVYERV